MKYDVNKIDHEFFVRLCKHLKSCYFRNKKFREAVMNGARPRNVYLKNRTETIKAAYNYQQSFSEIEKVLF